MLGPGALPARGGAKEGISVIPADRLLEALEELDLAGRSLMVHTSMRSFGEPVEGGADAVIDAMTAKGCTVLVPSFAAPGFDAAAPPELRPERNGVDYSVLRTGSAARTVRAAGLAPGPDGGPPVDPSMGALPAALLARGDARRGGHPLNSFAAAGPHASELVAAQTPADVYAPIRGLAERNGTVLLIGVRLDRMTALHLAEQRSGRRLFVRWAHRADGTVGMVEVGGCSAGFPRLEPHLRPYARTATVGASRWSAYPARSTLAAATEAMTADPGITRCGQKRCLRCEHSIAGGPLGEVTLG